VPHLVDVIIDLNIVIETAFTNILLVATPQVAVANGDNAMASVALSIQSDEARHMANGYGSIMALLENEDNVPLLNESRSLSVVWASAAAAPGPRPVLRREPRSWAAARTSQADELPLTGPQAAELDEVLGVQEQLGHLGHLVDG